MTDTVTPTQADLIERLECFDWGCPNAEKIARGAADTIATQAAEIAQLKQGLQLYLPPASISGDYGQGWVEGQAWMINCIRGEEDFDKAVPLTYALLEKDAEIAQLRNALAKCRPIIEYHISPARCVEIDGKIISAGEALQDAIAALSAQPSDQEGGE